MSEDGSDRTLTPWNDLSRQWPYSADRVALELDPALIEENWLRRLHRALKIGHLVAFVGSGVSMSYGRMSWSELVEQLSARMLAGSPGDSEIDRLRQTLRAVQEPAPNALGSDRFPIVFQIAEQLSRILKSDKVPDEAFRLEAMQLAYDDREHAKRIMWRALGSPSPPDSPEERKKLKYPLRFAVEAPLTEETSKDPQPSLTRAFRTAETNEKNYYWFLEYFSKKILTSLARKVSRRRAYKGRLAFVEAVDALLPDTRVELMPLHRWAIACLALLNRPSVVKAALRDIHPESRPRSVSRQALVPARRDPLMLLVDALNIRRFLTTNYDLEIERMLDARGYRIPGIEPADQARVGRTPDTDQPEHDRIDRRGGRARDLSFKNEDADRLIEFSAQEHLADFQVFHLHGRATRGDRLVVTSRDYDEVYVRADQTRDLVDEAIAITFGSNPLLFVGVGMEEGDLLRPLREFLTDKAPRTDRLAVALLPGKGGRQERDRDTISYYVRYRVYAVHTGTANYRDASGKAGPDDPDWLADVTARKDKLLEVIKNLKEPDAGSSDLREAEALESLKDLPVNVAYLDRIAAEGDLDVVPELTVLNAARHYLIDIARNATPSAATRKGELEALKISIEGAHGALTTASLCAKLLSLQEGARRWWEEWTEWPKERPVKFNLLPNADGKENPSRKFFVRHRIVVADPFVGDVRTRTFDGFIASGLITARPAKPLGRQIFLIVAGRGTGKGQFFTSFQKPIRLLQFIQAHVQRGGASVHETKDARKIMREIGRTYAAILFFNLSFSAEVASIWDGMAGTIEDVAERKPDPMDWARLSRRDRLRSVLKCLQPQDKRILIAFNAADVLFDADGYPKNGQIRQMVEILIGDEAAAAPVDLVLVTEEGCIPAYFRQPIGEADGANAVAKKGLEQAWALPRLRDPLVLLTRPKTHEFSKREIHERIRRHRLHVREEQARPWERPRNFVHFLRSSSAFAFANDYGMLPLLICLARVGWGNILKKSEQYFAEKSWQDANLWGLALYRGMKWERNSARQNTSWSEPERAALRPILSKIYEEEGLAWFYFRFALCLSELGRAPVLAAGTDIAGLTTDEAMQKAQEQAQEQADAWKEALKNWLRAPDMPLMAQIVAIATRTREDFDELFRRLDRSRFGLSLLLIAAKHMAEQGNPSEDRFRRVAMFLDTTLQRTQIAEGTLREELLIEEILKLYRSVGAEFGSGRSAGFDMDLALLRHIAVMGLPVDADVLAACPDVRDLALSATASQGGKLGGNPVVESLDRLVRRGLVFQVALPSSQRVSQGAAGQARKPCRYALHRSVHRHILRKFEAPPIDYSKADFYSISLYSIQQRDLPCPTAESYRFLQRLLGSLVGFPIPWHRSTPPDPPGSGTDMAAEAKSLAAMAHRLRAAFGIVRTVFSVVVISRYTDLDRLDKSAGSGIGYLEVHRQLCSWLLRLACKIDDRKEKLEAEQKELEVKQKNLEDAVLKIDIFLLFLIFLPLSSELLPLSLKFSLLILGAKDKQIKIVKKQIKAGKKKIKRNKLEPSGNTDQIVEPYFREQIVWLLNERAMFSLVQGKMGDAAAQFHQAARRVREIEGQRSESGPLETRVRLNRIVADIDMGRGRSALRHLERIAKLPDEHPAIRASARGWTGVIEALSGHRTAANEILGGAVTDLEALGHVRGASIFARHRGDLFRQLNDPREALRHFEQANALAEAGGHEDIRQYARLSLVRMRALGRDPDARAEVFKELKTIEHYARVMGIPRLDSDVFRTHADLLLREGETSLAGELAQKAMEIATLNDLVLRKIAALILLGKVNCRRNHKPAATRLLTLAIALARDAGYQTAIERAERELAAAGT